MEHNRINNEHVGGGVIYHLFVQCERSLYTHTLEFTDNRQNDACH
jgi:hypothetical protein